MNNSLAERLFAQALGMEARVGMSAKEKYWHVARQAHRLGLVSAGEIRAIRKAGGAWGAHSEQLCSLILDRLEQEFYAPGVNPITYRQFITKGEYRNEREFD